MLRWQARSYRRSFRQPMKTAHGLWQQREGIILRFEDEWNRHWFSEISPIPWFGTETLQAAEAFCDRWPPTFEAESISQISNTLPACQFGFGWARHPYLTSGCSDSEQKERSLTSCHLAPRNVCALLPIGNAALSTWPSLYQEGHRIFKWKIGVTGVHEEIATFKPLLKMLPQNAKVRLDANGGLTSEEAELWLNACDAFPDKIEFLEQPLSPDLVLSWLPSILPRFKTAIALDESVASLRQLQQIHQRLGSQIVYIVKPAIAGFPDQLLTFCLQNQLDMVVSSALETPIGRNAVLKLTSHLWQAGIPKRALGFGVGHWFADDWQEVGEEELWERL